jgi:hypothetical protein
VNWPTLFLAEVDDQWTSLPFFYMGHELLLLFFLPRFRVDGWMDEDIL